MKLRKTIIRIKILTPRIVTRIAIRIIIRIITRAVIRIIITRRIKASRELGFKREYYYNFFR